MHPLDSGLDISKPVFLWPDRPKGRRTMADKTYLKTSLTILVLYVGLAVSGSVQARVIYVDDDGAAEFDNIQVAIDDSNHGDIIVVNPGTYTGDGNRNINFKGKAITVRSIDPNDPNIVADTIIDCVGSWFHYRHGFYFHMGEEANSIIAGLTITKAFAKYHGGAIYCTASSPTITNCIIYCTASSPTITNCIIIGSYARYHGGGIYCENSSPRISNCIFSDNLANKGGAMYSKDGSPKLSNCTLNANVAGWGAGMYNEHAKPLLTNCTFTDNSIAIDWRERRGGGGMHNYESDPTLINCTFSRNSAEFGGGMCNEGSQDGQGSPTLKNCTFNTNSAVYGAGMSNWQSSPTLTGCTFTENSAIRFGAGMYNEADCSPTLTNCIFNDNSAVDSYGIWGIGGGMYNDANCSPTLKNCTFSGNLAGRGAGMCNKGSQAGQSTPTLANCTFKANSAGYGGGIYNEDILERNSGPILKNCSFSGNYGGSGGGMNNYRSSPTLTNCTFTGNSAYYPGGGIYNRQSSPTLTNCILWGDTPTEIVEYDNSTVAITYCDIQGAWTGEGNIDADPCFVDAGYWGPNGTPDYPWDDVWIEGDYHLLTSSPCIDAGDPNYVAGPNETDLDGKPRVLDGDNDGLAVVDMGAYEYSPPIPAEVWIIPRIINLASEGKYITCNIWLPEDYEVGDIEPNSVVIKNEPNDIYPELIWFKEQEKVVIAKFKRSDVQAILNVGDAELTITGQLTNGTVFEGTDIIRVIDKAGKK
jgi:hypothetical protein